MHLVPIGGSRTWEIKGVKHIKVHRQNNTWHIIVAISSRTSGKCLHFHANFEGITNKSLPKTKGERHDCEHPRWKCNAYQWLLEYQPLNTCKEFVENILLPYKDS